MLIRNVDDETVRRIDAAAERQGLSRNEYLRREVAQLAARAQRSTTQADLERASALTEDLSDEAVMIKAWR